VLCARSNAFTGEVATVAKTGKQMTGWSGFISGFSRLRRELRYEFGPLGRGDDWVLQRHWSGWFHFEVIRAKPILRRTPHLRRKLRSQGRASDSVGTRPIGQSSHGVCFFFRTITLPSWLSTASVTFPVASRLNSIVIPLKSAS